MKVLYALVPLVFVIQLLDVHVSYLYRKWCNASSAQRAMLIVLLPQSFLFTTHHKCCNAPAWSCLVSKQTYYTLTCGVSSLCHFVQLPVLIVKTVELVNLLEMRKTDCFGKPRLVPPVPSSS